MQDRPATHLFQPFLMLGERILWSGKPKQGFALRPLDAFLIPFSLLWGGFALFWNIGVWTFPDTGEGVGTFFKLWGLPFLAIGVYMIIGRFIHDAAIRKKIVYAVTDQRVLVLRGSRFSSLDLGYLPRLDLREHRDGTGTIAFEDEPSMFSFGRYSGMDWWVPSLSAGSHLFKIQNPRHVYQLIRDHSTRR